MRTHEAGAIDILPPARRATARRRTPGRADRRDLRRVPILRLPAGYAPAASQRCHREPQEGDEAHARAGLSVRLRRRYVKTTDSDHGGPIFPNLARDVALTGPNQLWVADL